MAGSSDLKDGRSLTKIVVTRTLKDSQVNVIKQAVPGAPLVCAGTREELLSGVGNAEAMFFVWGGVDVDGEVIHAAKDLKWIHVGSTGVEHMLIPEIVESAIIVTNSRTVHAVPVAEHALAMLLALAKNIHAYERNRACRSWQRYRSPLVEGATLGIIGFGAIGREIATRARAFGMRVLAVRGQPGAAGGPGDAAASGAGGLTPADRVFGPQGLLDVLALSDYVVVCTPLTAETRGLIGRKELHAMKKGSYLINVSRGGIVDETAIAEVLQEGPIAGAAFDVFGGEPLPAESPLWGFDNLIITPHVAGSRPDHHVALAEHFAENLRRWVAGEELLDVVDKHRGY